jgi:hypothetical protein
MLGCGEPHPSNWRTIHFTPFVSRMLNPMVPESPCNVNVVDVPKGVPGNVEKPG